MTENELLEALRTREPVMVYLDQCREWRQYAYIQEIYIRYDACSGEYITIAVISDNNLNSTIQQTADKIMRIKKTASPTQNSKIDVAAIQAQTLQGLLESMGRKGRL